MSYPRHRFMNYTFKDINIAEKGFCLVSFWVLRHVNLSGVILCGIKIFIFIFCLYLYNLLYFPFFFKKSMILLVFSWKISVKFLALNYLCIPGEYVSLSLLYHMYISVAPPALVEKAWVTHAWPMSNRVKTTSLFSFYKVQVPILQGWALSRKWFYLEKRFKRICIARYSWPTVIILVDV